MKEQKLSQQAYDKILELIKTRRYLPGDPLPENELSETLGMSRTPIREALHRLEDEQAVIIKPHLGAFVATMDLGQLCNIYETREAVDGMIARLACKSHVETGVFVDLRERLLAIQKISGDAERAAKLHEFAKDSSAALRGSCGNSMLANLSASILVRMDSMGFVTKTLPLFPDASVPERLDVLDAVIAKDADKAEETARVHVRNSFSRVMMTMVNNPKSNNSD